MAQAVYERMRERGMTLPEALEPVGLYLPVQESGRLLFVSGQGCIEHGTPLTGRVGKEVTIQEAARRAGVCMWNTLAALERHLGTLERIRRPVKLLGFVAGTEDFTGQAEIINAASQVLLDVFGENGGHARSAIGAHSLPHGLTVEIESIFEMV